MANRKVKCPTCGTMNDKENTEKINGRYYCIECAKKRKQEINKNKQGWDELFDYICELYGIKTLTGIMFKQIKQFKDEFNYTNAGILLTLKYYYETLENELKEDVALGIVPYYYERAKKDFIEKLAIKKYMDSFEDTEVFTNVKIDVSNTKDKINNRRKLLSFDNIDWSDEKLE